MSSKDKIQYVKPKVQDLGGVMPVHGGFCGTGSLNQEGTCSTGGTADGGDCGTGNSASGTGTICEAGAQANTR
jgi:hypothetical protein